MMGVPRGVFALVILLLLAGCSAKTPEPAPGEDPTPSSLGRISGAAVTPDIRPISGAQIAMQPGNFETKSNLFGGFTFENVPPGTYELTASHEDYVTTVEVFDVVAGQTLKARMVMQTDEPPVPQHFTDTFPGFFPLWAGPAEDPTAAAQEAAGVGNCTCVFDVATRAHLQTVVIEALWTDSAEPAEPTKFRWTLQVGNLSLTDVMAKASPVHISAAELGDWGNATSMTLTIEPDDTWPAMDQDFTAYVTVFQVSAAPAGWSFIANSN